MSGPLDSTIGGRVVVGTDGSNDSVAALRAAAQAAELLHATLVVVTTWRQAPTFGRTPSWLPDFQQETEEMQAAVLRSAFRDGPPSGLRRVVQGGDPGALLVKESEGARLVVVGRRGHGGFRDLLLGSTALSVVVHAHCSVLVLAHGVHRTPTDVVDIPGARRVVVGVDGGASSVRALAAAGRAAAELDARLDVVTAWMVYDGYPDTVDDLRDAVEVSVRAHQDAALARTVPDAGRARVKHAVREGSPSAVLVAEAEHADLLVVGIRSRSAVVELFTGAVAITTSAHARCPVLVVRERS